MSKMSSNQTADGSTTTKAYVVRDWQLVICVNAIVKGWF